PALLSPSWLLLKPLNRPHPSQTPIKLNELDGLAPRATSLESGFASNPIVFPTTIEFLKVTAPWIPPPFSSPELLPSVSERLLVIVTFVSVVWPLKL